MLHDLMLGINGSNKDILDFVQKLEAVWYMVIVQLGGFQNMAIQVHMLEITMCINEPLEVHDELWNVV